jgi:hypothetical protein
MNKIQGIKGSDKTPTDELATTTLVHGKNIEDEKERAIAKAALSIAELGASCHVKTWVFGLKCCTT